MVKPMLFSDSTSENASNKIVTVELAKQQEFMTTSIKEGEIAGVMTVKYDDELVASVNLVTKGAVSRSEFLFFLTVIRNIVQSRLFFLCVIGAIIVALFYVFLTAVYREKARRRAERRQRPELRRRR